jgi:hypothetical protein
MHHIPVRPPPSSALGRRSRGSKRAQRAFAPGPNTSPCAGGACRRCLVGRVAEQEQRAWAARRARRAAVRVAGRARGGAAGAAGQAVEEQEQHGTSGGSNGRTGGGGEGGTT